MHKDNTIHRDQPNSRFHGRNISCEISRFPWNIYSTVKLAIFSQFHFICEDYGLLPIRMYKDFVVRRAPHFN